MKPNVAFAVTLAATMTLVGTGPIEFADEAFDYDRDVPAAGFWLGNVRTDRFPETWAALMIEPGDAWSVRITLMRAGALNTPARSIEIDGRSAAFTLSGFAARFDGKLSPDGQIYSGTITFGDEQQPAADSQRPPEHGHS